MSLIECNKTPDILYWNTLTDQKKKNRAAATQQVLDKKMRH